jgi:hypothetical protein
MLQLHLVDFFEACNLANVNGIPTRLPEHVGANQPLNDDGEPGGEGVPLQRMAKCEHDHGHDVEGQDEPGRSHHHLKFADDVFETGQLIARYRVSVHGQNSTGVLLWYSVLVMPSAAIKTQSSTLMPGPFVV